jgi:hypothetical protein
MVTSRKETQMPYQPTSGDSLPPIGFVKVATVPAARADEEKARLEAGMREQEYCIALKSGDQCALYCPERKRR